MPKTESGNEYCLTMQDFLTKYCVVVQLCGITFIDIAEAFLKRFVYVFGSPKVVLTDQGSNFLSSLMRNVSKLCRIKNCTKTAFRPQSNDNIERMYHSFQE